MDENWFWTPLTLGAAAIQTIRTAGQKKLSNDVSNLMTTMTRFIFGLPFAILYLILLIQFFSWQLPSLNTEFIFFSAIASISQISGTILLIHMFSFRNFTIGTAYARTEAFLTAVLGALFFSESISLFGWFAIIVSIIGVIFITLTQENLIDKKLSDLIVTPEAYLGVASGLSFSLASLSLRRASLSLMDQNFLATAALTLVTVMIIETVILGFIILLKERNQFRKMLSRLRIGTFIGVTSMVGSVGWFTAMTLEQASFVKALGQIEFIFVMIISTRFFRESHTHKELIGIAMIALGSIALILL
jgi:drug/metabolite transporter (DMT)-like permease